MKELRNKSFNNGKVYLLLTEDGNKVETTDTFLPYYTKNAINHNTNKLKSIDLGSRLERWMIGVSVMSGCPVRCKFCATGRMKKFTNLKAQEIIDQIEFVISNNETNPADCKEFKINYTRMGEPFLNIEEVRKVIEYMDAKYPNVHHYISTVGIKGSDFSWVKDNITLQISVHSLDEARRDELIPFKNKLTLSELGKIRTKSNNLTTVNLSLVDKKDFNIERLKELFDPKCFFIKLSPINENDISIKHNIGAGIIKVENLL